MERHPVTVLHLGDHDPSGVHCFSALDEDVVAFAQHYGGDIEFSRLAVTPAQGRQYRLPSAPPKETNRRRFEGNETRQIEALDPRELANIDRTAIEARLNRAIFDEVITKEEDIRQSRAFAAWAPVMTTSCDLRRGEAVARGTRPGAGSAPEWPKLRLVSWQPMAKGVRPGLATVEPPTELELMDCPVLVGSNGPWARLPSKPVLGHEGKQVKPSGRRNSRLFSSGETASLAVVSGPQLPS